MNKQVKEIFRQIEYSNKKTRIKLLGDSITHGESGTGFKQDGESFIEGYSRNTSGYCWANLFKSHMEKFYNCEVINNACTGTTIEFIIENFDKLIDDEDDIILCNIGTNNRHQYFIDGPKRTEEEQRNMFFNNVIALNNLFKNKNKQIVFVANIPAAQTNEVDGENYWRIIHMSDINDLYMKAASQCGFPMISLYNLFNEYCHNEGVTVDSLLADGLHPNDAGYKVMFELLLKEIIF